MAVQPVVAADVQAVGARGGARNGERVITIYCLTNVQLLPQWVDLHAAAVIEQGLQPAAVVRGARDLAVVLPPYRVVSGDATERVRQEQLHGRVRVGAQHGVPVRLEIGRASCRERAVVAAVGGSVT